MRLFGAIFLSLICFSALASEKTFAFKSYYDATQSVSFLRFESESTKAGLISSTYYGYVRKFIVRYEMGKNEIKGGNVEFHVVDLDSNIHSRNKKMWNECLGKKSWPKILVVFEKSLPLGKKVVLDAIIKIRGEDRVLPLEIMTEKVEEGIRVRGKGSFSLKQYEIPDPSIFIAKVRDRFDVEFSLLL